MKLETIRRIVAIQLDDFCFKLNAKTGPKNKPVITPQITPIKHSEVSSLIPNKLEIIGANSIGNSPNSAKNYKKQY